jgi:hypothetical protein
MDKALINPYDERGLILDFKGRFFGRKQELREVYSRLATMQSVSVIGERRIGKSSFLNRIAHPDIEAGELDQSFRLFYLDLQRVFSAEEFYDRACKLLGREQGESRLRFEEAIENQKVILCLDEFEQAYKEDFGGEFFNVLRSLAQTGNLALVVATQEPLSQLHRLYLEDEDVTSKFHNIFAQVKLGPFSPEEAREMVAAPCDGHRFSAAEVNHILEIAGNHPYRLSVACALAYEAKRGAGATEIEIDFVELERKFQAEMADAAPLPEPAATVDVQPETQSLPQPKRTTGPTTDVALNPLLLFAAAIFFLIGAINIWDVSQRQNPVSLTVAAVCFILTVVLMLTETVRFGRQAWRSWRSR